MKYLISFFFLFAYANVFTQVVSIGERYNLESNVLEENREYLVHLPSSYYHSTQTKYPVVYLLDGDYNFGYVAGLLDQMSSISGQIPEMILIGITDKGTQKYQSYMTPTMNDDLFNPKSGKSDSFSRFIESELQPLVDKEYRTLPYEILIGHSAGGMFAINCLLENPDYFDAYLAISPSLWVNDKMIESKADSLLRGNLKLDKFLYITLADETKMGVYSFVDIVDYASPPGLNWKFKKYENENHNSVGLVSIRDGLRFLFKDYEIDREKFTSLESFSEARQHFEKYQDLLGGEIIFPEILIGNMMSAYTREGNKEQIDLMEEEIEIYFPASLETYLNIKALYQLAAGEKELALETYQNKLESYPNSYRFHQGMAKVYAAQGKSKQATNMMEKALSLAKEQKTAQWMLNILLAELDALK